MYHDFSFIETKTTVEMDNSVSRLLKKALLYFLRESCYCKVLHTVKLYLYAVSIFISCGNILHRKKSDNIVSCLLNGQLGISWWKRHRKKCLLCVIIIPNLKFLFFMWLTILRLLSMSCNPRTWLLQKRPWNSCWEIIITYSKSSVWFFL